MALKNWGLPLLLLLIILFIKCKNSTTGATESTLKGRLLTLVAPKTNSEQPAPVTLQWEQKGNVKSFQFRISGSKDFKTTLVDSTVDTTRVKIRNLPRNTTIYWEVRSSVQDMKTQWSEVRNFKTVSKSDSSPTDKLAAPVQGAPSDKAKDVARKPKFKWKGVDGADAYELHTGQGDKQIIKQQVHGTDFTPRKALFAKKTYYWRVRAIAGKTKGKWSKKWHFTTVAKSATSSAKKLAAPAQVAPSDKAKDVARKPKFKWKAVDGADAYELHTSHGDKMIIKQQVHETGFTPKEALSAKKTYHWRVRAIAGETKGTWSAVHSFTTDPDTISTELQAPKDGAENRPVNLKLQWKQAPDASKYKVQLAQGEQFKTLTVDKSIKDTSYKVSGLKHHKEYSWRVKPLISDKETEWSKARHFNTRAKAKLAAPAQVAPSDKAKDIARKPKFKWKAVDGADAYQLDASHGDKLVIHQQVHGTDFTPRDALLAEKTYHWRVRAIAGETKGTWSPVHSFTTDSPPGQTGGGSSVSTDRKALMDLYKATDGDHWKNNRGWDNGNPSDSWYGIKTNAKGRVTRVDLWQNNLRGQLPASIGNLDKVTYFNVKGNHLTGKIPATIGNMASLEELILQGRNYELDGHLEPPVGRWNGGYHQGKHYSNTNEFSGQIPAQIGKLSNLIALEISNAKQITGSIPSELGNLTNLKGLYLSGDDFSGTTLPSSLGNLTNLKHLYIEGAGLVGKIPDSYENLTKLSAINVGEFGYGENNKNFLSGEIPDFSQMTDLTRFILADNEFTGQFPQYVNNGNFKQLNILNLAGNKLTGEIPGFTNLPNLYSFTARSNNLTGGLNRLTQVPAKIKIISIALNDISGDFPQSGWPDFYELKTIKFQGNNITGNIPCSFWNKIDNPKLRRAFFDYNKIENPCSSGANAVVGVGGKLDLRY